MSGLDDTQRKILDAAGIVFGEKGYDGATFRHIAEKAGVHFSLINYHFRNKDQLYRAAVQHAYQLTVERVPSPVWTAQTPPAQKLRDFVRTFLRRVVVDHEPIWPCRLIMREIFQPTEACKHIAEGFAKPNFQQLQGILTELLPADTSVTRRNLITFSIIGQMLHYRLARNIAMFVVGPEEFAGYDVEVLTEHITRFSLAALGHGHGRSGQGGPS